MTPWPFGLQTAPFPAVVDPRRYYPASTHELALRNLVGGWQEGEPWLALSGPAGSGKTLLLHLLMEQIPQGTKLAYVSQPPRDSEDLIRLVAHDWHLDDGLSPSGYLRNRLIEAILEGLKLGSPPLVILEQAESIGTRAMDELVNWSHLQGRGQAGIQVVLVAGGDVGGLTTLASQHSAWEMVGGGGMIQLLEPVEACDFLRFQLRWAGAQPNRILNNECEEKIIELGQGNPRRLCQLGRLACRLAVRSGLESIELEAIEEAALQLWGDPAAVQPQARHHGIAGTVAPVRKSA